MRRLIFAALLLTAACDADKRPGAATPAVDESKEPEASWKAGDKVDVHWGTSWWRAVVLEARSTRSFKVHYVGFPPSSDERVGSSRVRARGPTANIGKTVDEPE